jgi:hypothetical protein
MDFKKCKNNYVKTNIFLEDTFLDFNLKFSKLTDLELSELFWLWEISKNKTSDREIYINQIKSKLGEESANKILDVSRLSFTVHNRHELIFREIRNRWLAKLI